MTAQIRVGNAPVSWGVFEASGPNPAYGTVLDAIVSAGYEGTELGPYGYLPTDPAALSMELSRRGLALASSFVDVPLEDAHGRSGVVATVLKVGRLLSTHSVPEVILADVETEPRRSIAGRVPGDNSAGWTDREWAAAIGTVHAAARALRSELDMRLVFHHHVGTHVETCWEIDRFLSETDPELVGLLLDTGHAVYGGADPLDILRRYGKRVRYVHFKDASETMLGVVRTSEIGMLDAWKKGVFCPLGEGVVDFPQIVELLRGLDYRGWGIVEQDVVARSGRLDPDPTESARKSRIYLREKCRLM